MEGLAAGNQEMLVLIGVVACAFLGLLIFGFTLLGRPARQMRKRIERAATQSTTAAVGSRQASVRRDTSASSIPSLDKLARMLIPNTEELRNRLARTGKNISVAAYGLISLLVALTAVAGLMNFTNLALAPTILIGTAIGILLPYSMVGRMISKRRKRFVNQFPEAIDIIVRGIRSGLPVTESMTIVSREMSGPVGEEFAHISDGMKLGQTLEEILWEATKRTDVPEFRFFVISLSIQRETGGNLAETLENLSDVLRKRQQMRLKVKAMSSEARASAMIIAALPFVMMGIILTVNSGYIMQLFTDNRGIVMLVVAAASLTIGIAVMAKMIKFEI